MKRFKSGLSRYSFATMLLPLSLIVLILTFPFASSALDEQQTNLPGGELEQGKTILDNPEKMHTNIVVEENTKLPVILDSAISSDKSKNGDKITAHLSEDLNIDGAVALPVGSKVEGRIIKFEDVGPPKRVLMELRFDSISLDDNVRIPVKTEVQVYGAVFHARRNLKDVGIAAAKAGSNLSILSGVGNGPGNRPVTGKNLTCNDPNANLVDDNIRQAHFAADSIILLAKGLLKIDFEPGDEFKVLLKENLNVSR